MMMMTTTMNATCFLQTTCTNVPVLSTPTPVVISLEKKNATTITKLRTTKRNSTAAAAQVNNNVNNLQIKYKNNNSNNNNNKVEDEEKEKNNSNYININNKNLQDDNKNYSMKSVSGSSCCQCCCEHKNHYEQHALQQQHEEEQPAVQRHVKHTKTTTANLKSVVRNCDNNNNVECSKQGKLFEKHHCTAASLLQQRQFSANTTTTATTKCDEMSNMRPDTETETKITLQTPFAVKKCATVESSYSSTPTTTTKATRLIGIGRSKKRPLTTTTLQTLEPTTATTTTTTTTQTTTPTLLSYREASTITLPQSLLKVENSMPANVKANVVVENDVNVDSVKLYASRRSSSSRDSMQLVMPIEENCRQNKNNGSKKLHQVQSKTTINNQLLKKEISNNIRIRIYHNNNKNTTKVNKTCSTVSSDKCFKQETDKANNNNKPSLEVLATKHIPLDTLSITIFSKLLATLALMVATSIKKITATTTASSYTSSKWLSTTFTLLLLTTTAYCWNGRQDGKCKILCLL